MVHSEKCEPRIPKRSTPKGRPQNGQQPVPIGFPKRWGLLFTSQLEVRCENCGPGCRPSATIFDIRERVKMRWPLDDEIRWIEWRLRELEKGKACSAPLTLQDCHVWLAHKRDGKSYADIARAQYPQFWDTNKGKRGNQKIISLVRRTVDRVEQYLTHPNRKHRNSKPRQLADVVLSSFGVVPIYVETRSPARGKTRSKRNAK